MIKSIFPVVRSRWGTAWSSKDLDGPVDCRATVGIDEGMMADVCGLSCVLTTYEYRTTIAALTPGAPGRQGR